MGAAIAQAGTSWRYAPPKVSHPYNDREMREERRARCSNTQFLQQLSRQDKRGIWRVREDDLAAYIDAAYKKTAERIASGQIPEGDAPSELDDPLSK